RRGFARESMHAIRRATRILFDAAEGTLPQRLERVESQFRDCEPVQKIVAFLRAAGQRPLCWPRHRDQD
ncbi:MAG: hypothetical protein ACXW2A_09880, partial [Burkholderiales bacterium]